MVDDSGTKKVGIVISSAGADEAFARRLEAGLNDLYKIWYYKNSITRETGDWDAQIDNALSKAKIVLGVISPASVAADNVRKEWLWVEQYARKHGIIFLLVEHQPADPGHQFSSYTWTSFSNKPFEDALRELRTHIRRSLQRKITAAVDAVNPVDPYARDLKTLWNRVQKMLRHLIIPSLESEPMELEALLVRDGVASTEKSRDFVDLVLQRVGVGEDFRNIYSAFDAFGRRLLLLGAPGSGKTVTWLLQIRDAILARLDDQTAPMPVIANIQSWDGTPLIDWLAKYPFTPKNTKTLIEEGRAILFIDGLDELTDVNLTSGADDQYALHRAFMQQIPLNCDVLVTCRTVDYERMNARIPLNGAVCLTPLTEDQIEEFLKNLPELWEIVKSDTELMQMVSTPLYLSMFAFTCEQMRPDKRAKLLTNVAQGAMFRELLVLEYVRQLYNYERRRVKERTLKVPVERLMDGLGRVAMRNVAFSSSITNSVTVNELKFISSAANGSERDDMTKLALSLGLLQPNDKNRYKFIHMMVRDTLAFYYCTRHYRELAEYTDRNANIALALGRLKDERATRFLRIILQDVPHEKVRPHVAKAFSYNRDPDTVKDLLKLLRDSDEFVQAYAIEGLAAIHNVEPIDAIVVEPVLAVLKRTSSRTVRKAACVALGVFGSDKAIDPLIELLKDPNPLTMTQAAQSLARLDAQRAIPSLREAYKQADATSKLTLIDALGRLHDTVSVPMLLDMVRTEKKAPVLTVVIDALGRIGSPTAVPELIRRLTQNHLSQREELSGDVRASIASALGAIGDPQAIAPLKEVLRTEKNERTFNYVLDALSKLGCEDAPMFELPMFDMDTDPGDTDESVPLVTPPRPSLADTRPADDGAAGVGGVTFL